jgi:hypothetical protein
MSARVAPITSEDAGTNPQPTPRPAGCATITRPSEIGLVRRVNREKRPSAGVARSRRKRHRRRRATRRLAIVGHAHVHAVSISKGSPSDACGDCRADRVALRAVSVGRGNASGLAAQERQMRRADRLVSWACPRRSSDDQRTSVACVSSHEERRSESAVAVSLFRRRAA